MKKLLPIFFAATIMATAATATIHTVMVENFKFTPSALTVNVGDTVKWSWVNGSHTTTSTTVPAGAAPWDAPVVTGTPTFSYKVTVAGTYSYVCTPHAPGMAGTITAQSTSGVSTAGAGTSFRMYPNPAADNLRIEVSDAHQQVSIVITDALGRAISSDNYSGSKTIDISTAGFANGMYSIHTVTGGKAYAQSFEVAH